MAKDKTKNKNPKKTPEQFALELNAGGAYFIRTNDVVGAATAVGDNGAIKEVVEFGLLRNLAMGYETTIKEYQSKLTEYNSLSQEKREKREKPSFEEPNGFSHMEAGYGILQQSMKMRSETFEKAYSEITVGQMNTSFYLNGAKRYIPKKIQEKLENLKDIKIKDLEEPVKNMADTIKKFYLMSNVPRQIQGVELRKTLEGLITEAPNSNYHPIARPNVA